MKLLQITVLMAALCEAALCGPALSAQAINWQRIVTMPGPPDLPAEQLSASQRRDLEQAIVASNTVWDDCEDDNDWPHAILVHRVNLGPGHYTLAEAGVGCARGGQGSNGAMWLLRWDAGKPVVIGDLDGWLRVVLPEISNGLHDVAVGWHMSAFEYGLTLYRFNGKKYRLVDGTDVHCDEGTGHCAASPGSGKPAAAGASKPQAAGAVATPTKESAHP